MFDEKLFLRPVMHESYLIQRLRAPESFRIGGQVCGNPFSFGGGLRNGGLSKDAMDLLRNIFSFDYMGSSEFEWGAVPAALRFIAEQASKNNIRVGVLDLEKGEQVYYLTPNKYEEEVKNRIKLLRKGKMHLEKYCGLDQYFDEDSKWAKETRGWLEINNGYMFFVDKEMFDKTCSLFGIKVAV